MAPASFFGKMLEASSLDDVRQNLGDTLVGERLAATAQLKLTDKAARQAYRAVMEEIRSVSPSPDVADLVLWREELRSLKNHVKRKHLQIEASAVPSRYGEEAWERLWAGLETELPAVFAAVVGRTQALLGLGSREPGFFDAAFDSASLWALCDAARRTGSELAAEYHRRFDAVKGVELLWRARALGLGKDVQDVLFDGRQYEELFAALRQSDLREWPAAVASALSGLDVNSLAPSSGAEPVRAFVRAADAWLMDFARQARLVAFGPERVFGCLVGLDAEAHNVAIVVAGRAQGISPDRLRGHLRACYV